MRRYLVSVLAVLALVGAACSKSSSPSTADATDTGVPAPACSDLSADNPFTITIINEDTVTHTFTIDGTQVDVTIAAGTTFNGDPARLSPGDYPFHYKIHSSMAGTLTVA
jgi:hypothetical protein